MDQQIKCPYCFGDGYLCQYCYGTGKIEARYKNKILKPVNRKEHYERLLSSGIFGRSSNAKNIRKKTQVAPGKKFTNITFPKLTEHDYRNHYKPKTIVATEVECLSCGNKKPFTLNVFKLVFPRVKITSDRGIALYLRRVKGRLVCSKCGRKNNKITTIY